MPATAVDRIDGLTTSVAVKAPARTVTSANITLAGLQTIGSVTVVDGDRVLVVAQTDSTQNGIYNASSGNWTRARDFDGNRDAVQGTMVIVQNGTVQGAIYELTTTNPIVIGTTALIFTLRFSANTRYDQTAAEIAALVTPTNYYISPGDPRGSVLRYGAVADGVTDDSAAIQRALNCKGLVTLPPNKVCLINTGLTMDTATTTLDGNGGAIKYPQTSGTGLTVDSSQGAENEGRNGLRNFIIYGNLPIVGTAVGIAFIASGVNPVANVNVEHVTSSFFYISYRIHTNAFCINFSGCMASNSTFAVQITASSEKNSFNHCFLGNCTTILQSSTSSQTVMVNCSLDYSNTIIDMQSGYAFLDNCYVESNLDTDYWFKTGTSENAQIRYRGGVIVNGGTKTIPIANAGSGSVQRFENVLLYSNNNSVGGDFLGSGAGSVYAKDCAIVGFTQNSQCWVGGSPAQNLCDNGFFTANLTGWTLASTGGSLIPAFNAGSGSAGQGGMEFHTNVAATGSTATWTVPAQPGQVCGVKLAAKAENVVAKFQFFLQAIGGSGAVIATSDLLNGINQFGAGTNFADTSFHTYRNAFSRLPAGTTSVKVVLSSDYSAGWKVWASDVVICTY